MTTDIGDTPEDPVLHVQQTGCIDALAQIVFFQSTYIEKTAKHLELAETGHGIEEFADTFSKPQAVYEGNEPGRNYVFVSGEYDFMGHPLIVTAQIVEADSGRFTSAYYTSDFAQREPIWTESSNA